MEFKQEPFFKSYIKRNTEFQREAEKEGNKIKRQNAKSRHNAILGKLTENSMKKIDVKILTTRKQYLKWSFRTIFKREKQFHNGAIVMEKEKCRTNLNKPIYIGTNMLDLSKVLMQDLHYNYVKNKYGDKAEILLTDTDFLMKQNMMITKMFCSTDHI